MRSCIVREGNPWGVHFVGQTVLLEDNIIEKHHSAEAALWASSGSMLTGSRNIIRGYSDVMRTINSRIELHDGHIISQSGYAVNIEGHDTPLPQYIVDLSNNWWGTTDGAAIAEMIYDMEENSHITQRVIYEPFATGPVPAEKKSLGGVKALFR